MHQKKPIQKKIPSRKINKTSLNSYARFSSIAIQMVVIIIAGTYGGLQLDKWIDLKFPLFTLICALASVAIAIYSVIKDFIKH